MPPNQPTVVILCGGRGTRIQEHSAEVPKPLIEIGGLPIAWHMISMYLAHGFRRFLLLTGHRAEQVQEFVAAEPWPRDARLMCLDTLDVLKPGSVLEREPLERLAASGQLRAFRHEGFWECMDTHKDWITLNALWAGGPPWVSDSAG